MKLINERLCGVSVKIKNTSWIKTDGDLKADMFNSAQGCQTDECDFSRVTTLVYDVCEVVGTGIQDTPTLP